MDIKAVIRTWTGDSTIVQRARPDLCVALQQNYRNSSGLGAVLFQNPT